MKTFEETKEYLIHQMFDRYAAGANDYRPTYEESAIICVIYEIEDRQGFINDLVTEFKSRFNNIKG